MSVGRSALLTYNAALNRPAYQSSVYVYDGRKCSADLANDGSRETRLWRDNTCRCSHTNHEPNPWWAVDLGHPTTVYGVNFTNRGDQCGHALVLI